MLAQDLDKPVEVLKVAGLQQGQPPRRKVVETDVETGVRGPVPRTGGTHVRLH